LVGVSLLETLTRIACDYINPNGEQHHGIPSTSHPEPHRAIREAGEILDADTEMESSGTDSPTGSLHIRVTILIEQWEDRLTAAEKLKAEHEARGGHKTEGRLEIKIGVIRSMLEELKWESRQANDVDGRTFGAFEKVSFENGLEASLQEDDTLSSHCDCSGFEWDRRVPQNGHFMPHRSYRQITSTKGSQ
jgi:hypothetical protein